MRPSFHLNRFNQILFFQDWVYRLTEVLIHMVELLPWVLESHPLTSIYKVNGLDCVESWHYN